MAGGNLMARFRMNWGYAVLLGIGFVFLSFVLIALLGSFPGMASGPRYESLASGGSSNAAAPGAGGVNKAAPAAVGNVASGGSYWVYNPFSGGNSLFFFVVVIIFPIVTLLRLREKTEKNDWKTAGAGFLGSVLLFGSLFVFTGAFQDMLSLYPSSSSEVTAGRQYGWLALSAVMLVLGAVCLYLAEKWRKECGSPRPVYSVVAHNVGLYLALYSALMLATYSGMFLDVLQRSADGTKYLDEVIYSPMRLFGWLMFGLIAAGISYKVLEYSKKGAKGTGMARFAFSTPASLCALILFASGVAYLMAFTAKAIWAPDKMPLPMLLVGAIFTAVSLCMLRWRLKRQEEEGIVRTAHYWPMLAGVILAIIGLFGGIFAFNDLMQATEGNAWAQVNSTNSLAMFVAYLIYGLALAYVAHSWARNKYEAKGMQEGSFTNWLFNDADAKQEGAAAGLPAEQKAEDNERRLRLVERRLENLERTASLEKRVGRLEEKTGARKK